MSAHERDGEKAQDGFNMRPFYIDKHVVVCRAHYAREYLTKGRHLPRFTGQANCWYCIQEGKVKI